MFKKNNVQPCEKSYAAYRAARWGPPGLRPCLFNFFKRCPCPHHGMRSRRGFSWKKKGPQSCFWNLFCNYLTDFLWNSSFSEQMLIRTLSEFHCVQRLFYWITRRFGEGCRRVTENGPSKIWQILENVRKKCILGPWVFKEKNVGPRSAGSPGKENGGSRVGSAVIDTMLLFPFSIASGTQLDEPQASERREFKKSEDRNKFQKIEKSELEFRIENVSCSLFACRFHLRWWVQSWSIQYSHDALAAC